MIMRIVAKLMIRRGYTPKDAKAQYKQNIISRAKFCAFMDEWYSPKHIIKMWREAV